MVNLGLTAMLPHTRNVMLALELAHGVHTGLSLPDASLPPPRTVRKGLVQNVEEVQI